MVTTGAITKRIDRLEGAGLVTRRPDASAASAEHQMRSASASASGGSAGPSGSGMPRQPLTSDAGPEYQAHRGVRKPANFGSSTRTPAAARASASPSVSGSGGTDA